MFSLAFGRWWVLPTSFALGLSLFAWGYYPVAAVQYRQTRERQQLAAELKTLQARNHRLRDQVERLKTPEGVEDYARSQLGLVKQGEHAVRVVDGDEASEMSKTVAAPTIDSDETPKSDSDAWTAFLDLVFGFR
ncbi:MAG TPA: septum formation initiator family protein [Coriobacteriia bacterium]|nr:septum formation initiator family protein [Coriobacteriia bacterium]